MNDDRVENPQQARTVTIVPQMLSPKTTVLRVAGDMRGDAAGAVLRTLAGELISPPDVVVLDLCEVSNIDVVGLDVLHTAAGLAAEDDIWFCLVDTPDGAVRVGLDAVGSAKDFEIFSSVTHALRHAP